MHECWRIHPGTPNCALGQHTTPYDLWYHFKPNTSQMVHVWCKTGRKAFIIVTQTLSMMVVAR